MIVINDVYYNFFLCIFVLGFVFSLFVYVFDVFEYINYGMCKQNFVFVVYGDYNEQFGMFGFVEEFLVEGEVFVVEI